MRDFIISFITNVIIIAVITSGFLPGIRIEAAPDRNWVIIAIVAVIFGVVNSLVKPILKLLTCSLIFFTLGLFIFVINAAMLQLTAFISGQLQPYIGGRLVVDTFGNALVAALVVSILNLVLTFILNRLFGGDGRRVVTRTEVRYVVQNQRAALDQEFDAAVRPPQNPYPQYPPQVPPGQYPPQGGYPPQPPPNQYPPNQYPPGQYPPQTPGQYPPPPPPPNDPNRRR